MSLLAAEGKTDPVIDGFLAFLAQDMARNPSHIAAVPAGLAERMTELTVGMNVDLNDGIDGALTL